MDPLAEGKPWMSPYLYCSNNPLNRIDPDGMWDFWQGMKGIGQMVGGALEMVAGGIAIAAPEPTMATKIVGGIAVGHGDVTVTGFKNTFLQSESGHNTLTQTALTEGSKSLGASDATAQKIGEYGDAAIGIGLSLGTGVTMNNSRNLTNSTKKITNSETPDLVKVRHHTSPSGLSGIKESNSINASKGVPYGVDVEVAPFLRPSSVNMGQAGKGAYVEFSIPKSQISTPPSYMGGTGNAGRIVTGGSPLNLGGTNPSFKRDWWKF